MPNELEKEFSQRLDDQEQTLNRLSAKVDKIHDAIVGNTSFDQRGIVDRLKNIENKLIKTDHDLSKVKDLKNKLIGAFIAAGALLTVLERLLEMALRK